MNPYALPYERWSPRMLATRFPVPRLNRNGIPSLRTISVTTDTAGAAVIYNLCQMQSLTQYDNRIRNATIMADRKIRLSTVDMTS